MFEERFIQLVEENGGFEFYQAYRNDVDHILGGKGNTYWYVIMKKGKVTGYINSEFGGQFGRHRCPQRQMGLGRHNSL